MFEVYAGKDLEIETNTDVDNLTIAQHDYTDIMKAQTPQELTIQFNRHNNINELGTASIISKIISLFSLRNGKNTKSNPYAEYELTSDQIKLINLLERVFALKMYGKPMVQQLKLLNIEPHLFLSMSYIIVRTKRQNNVSLNGNLIGWLNCIMDAYLLRCILDDRLKQWVTLLLTQVQYELDRTVVMREIEGQFEEIEKRGEAIAQSRDNNEIKRIPYQL